MPVGQLHRQHVGKEGFGPARLDFLDKRFKICPICAAGVRYVEDGEAALVMGRRADPVFVRRHHDR
jgi:hypothetical protein